MSCFVDQFEQFLTKKISWLKERDEEEEREKEKEREKKKEDRKRKREDTEKKKEECSQLCEEWKDKKAKELEDCMKKKVTNTYKSGCGHTCRIGGNWLHILQQVLGVS